MTDKLLWGSDVPMILADKTYKENEKDEGNPAYKHLMASFDKHVVRKLDTGFYESLTQTNPRRFLFAS